MSKHIWKIPAIAWILFFTGYTYTLVGITDGCHTFDYTSVLRIFLFFTFTVYLGYIAKTESIELNNLDIEKITRMLICTLLVIFVSSLFIALNVLVWMGVYHLWITMPTK